MKKSIVLSALALVLCLAGCGQRQTVIFSDDYATLANQNLGAEVGPLTEYHFIKDMMPRGAWAVTSFANRGEDTAWRVNPARDGAGWVLAMTHTRDPKVKKNHAHKMVCAGSDQWKDYTFETAMMPHLVRDKAGIIFRYQTDRQYYYFGMAGGDKLVLQIVNDEYAMRKPVEINLAEMPYSWQADKKYEMKVEVYGDQIRSYLDGEKIFEVQDTTWKTGKIALVADNPTDFYPVKVTAPAAEAKAVAAREKAIADQEAALQAANPKPVLWKKIDTRGWGVGRNLRFGDLSGDGQIDILVGQIVHHNYPGNSLCELSCLTAVDVDGNRLWRIGEPDPSHWELTNDVAFQIADINNDGKNEVIYTMGCELIIAEGATGKTLKKIPTPKPDDKQEMFDRILGDCIYLCDVSGRGYDSDIIIKDRYRRFWVYDRDLNLLWTASENGDLGHYPYAFKMDEQGTRDYIAIGQYIYTPDGKRIWNGEADLKHHTDGIAVVNFHEKPDSKQKMFIAGSDEGGIFLDNRGNILKHHFIGHVQNPVILNLRDDMPGLEVASINFWGNQGIIHLFDGNGDIYKVFEPAQFGSMMLPVNWTGRSEEFFLLNSNVKLGGMFDGWGRKAVVFPDDGHPDMCNGVLDMTGDCRDEIVTWDPDAIWIYTQSDSPQAGKLYKPIRNPLYNYSNYQLSVSEEGWSE